MKISAHVSSDKSLRLRDSTDSAVGITVQDTQRFTQKKKKEKLAKENSVLISSAIYFI